MSVIGIDLGTSQSSGCFSYGKDDKNKEKFHQVLNELIRSGTITLNENEKAHPSYVQYDRNGIFIVAGIRAKHLASMSPKTTIYDSKRLIARRNDDPKVQEFQKLLDERGHYEICANDKGEATIKIGDSQKSPEEVSSEIILDILKDAFEQEINLKIDRMVISVPAYFNEIQKSRTKMAAILAIKKLQKTEYIKRIQIKLGDERPENVTDIELISEPSAALITYMAKTGLEEIPNGKYILVFDLGAGTLDISIGTPKKIRNPRGGEEYELKIKITHGDTILGGRDMDQKIIEWAKPQLPKINDNLILSELTDKAEKAKIKLSSIEKTAIRFNDDNNEISLDRKELEKKIASILERCRVVIRETLKIGGIKKEEIAVVVMVGGPTKMPSVRRLVEEEIGINIADVAGWDPMLCVAEGAARHATGEGGIDEPINFDYYVAPVMFDIESTGINVGTKIASVGDRANVDCNEEIFVPLYVPSKASEGFGVIKLRMVRKDTDLKCIQEILISVASQFVDRSDEHCKVKKIKYSGKMLNGDFPFGYEKVKINFRINNEGLMMMPGFTQNRNGNKIIYPDLPVEDKGNIKIVDWTTFFDKNWDKLAREFLERVDEILGTGTGDDDGIDPNKIPLDELKLIAKGLIGQTSELKQTERLKDLIKQVDKSIIEANIDTPSKKSKLVGTMLALQTYLNQHQAMR